MPAHEAIEPVEQHLGVVGPAQPALQGPDRRLAAHVDAGREAGGDLHHVAEFTQRDAEPVHAARPGHVEVRQADANVRRGPVHGLGQAGVALGWRGGTRPCHDGRTQPRAVVADPGPGGMRDGVTRRPLVTPSLLFEVAAEWFDARAVSRALHPVALVLGVAERSKCIQERPQGRGHSFVGLPRNVGQFTDEIEQREQPARADTQSVDRAMTQAVATGVDAALPAGPLLVECTPKGRVRHLAARVYPARPGGL